MNAGMIVCSGRLRPASTLGLAASSENPAPRLCHTNPAVPTVSPAPNPTVL